jgi:hypothetical protein
MINGGLWASCPRKVPPPPENLGEHGRALWCDLVAAYAFNAAESCVCSPMRAGRRS